MSKKNNGPKKYKAYQIGLISVLAIILIALSVFVVGEKLNERKEQNKLMDSFYEYFARDELTVIYYTSTGCSFCELETPLFETIAKDYDIDYLEIDRTKLSKSQDNKINELLGDITGTPTTFVVKNEKVIAVQKGYVDGPKFVEFLIKAGVLDEGSVYNPEKNITFIDYEEFKGIKEVKTPTVVAIGASTCTYCLSAKPIFSNLAKAYNIPIYYITLDYISVDDRKSLYSDLKEMGFDDENFVKSSKLSTPTIIVVDNGKITGYSIGLKNVTEYTKFFEKNNVI